MQSRIRNAPATHAEPANFSPGYPYTMPVQTPVKSICRISCPFDEVEDGFVVAALMKAADGGGWAKGINRFSDIRFR